jgi:hypothetical protein
MQRSAASRIGVGLSFVGVLMRPHLVAKPSTSALPDVTIRTRWEPPNFDDRLRSYGSAWATIDDYYVSGEHRRNDLGPEVTTMTPDGPHVQRQSVKALIADCKRRRFAEVDLATKLAGVQDNTPFPDWHNRVHVIDSVDTGERWHLGSYSARHVITHAVSDLGPAVPATTFDGWYLDLPTPSCDDAPSMAAYRGVPVSEERRGFRPAKDNKREPWTERLTLREFAERALDERLFEVPPDFGRALKWPNGRFDTRYPDTPLNRVWAAWKWWCGRLCD